MGNPDVGKIEEDLLQGKRYVLQFKNKKLWISDGEEALPKTCVFSRAKIYYDKESAVRFSKLIIKRYSFIKIKLEAVEITISEENDN